MFWFLLSVIAHWDTKMLQFITSAPFLVRKSIQLVLSQQFKRSCKCREKQEFFSKTEKKVTLGSNDFGSALQIFEIFIYICINDKLLQVFIIQIKAVMV